MSLLAALYNAYWQNTHYPPGHISLIQKLPPPPHYANGLATDPNRVQETSGSQSGRFRVRASLDGSKRERP